MINRIQTFTFKINNITDQKAWFNESLQTTSNNKFQAIIKWNINLKSKQIINCYLSLKLHPDYLQSYTFI